VPGAWATELAAESSMGVPARTEGVEVERTAMGAGWISMVMVAGAL